MIKSDERLTFAACWGHARRKVVEANTYAKECELLLGMIQALYDIETRAKDMTWQERQALRERESTIVLDAIWRWLDTTPLQAVLPKSDFAEALNYIRNPEAIRECRVEERRDKAERKQLDAARRRLANRRLQ